MSALLAAVAVSREFRRGGEVVQAVADVSLTLEPGRFVLLRGPSGSGKTSLLNLLAGWDRPDRGHVAWRGSVVDPATLAWADLAVVPQRLGLLDELTLRENAALPHRLAGGDPGEVDRLLQSLDLGDLADAFPAEVSAGQRQRAAVVRAAGVAPSVLLADEPTSSQDEASARRVFAEVRALAGAGAACLVAGHDPVGVEYADAVIDMRDGRIER